MQTTTNRQEPTREEFRKLPITERRKVLRRQARQLVACYAENSEINGIGGGDFVEPHQTR